MGIRKNFSEKFKLELAPEARITRGMLKETIFQADHSGKGHFPSEAHASAGTLLGVVEFDRIPEYGDDKLGVGRQESS